MQLSCDPQQAASNPARHECRVTAHREPGAVLLVIPPRLPLQLTRSQVLLVAARLVVEAEEERLTIQLLEQRGVVAAAPMFTWWSAFQRRNTLTADEISSSVKGASIYRQQAASSSVNMWRFQVPATHEMKLSVLPRVGLTGWAASAGDRRQGRRQEERASAPLQSARRCPVAAEWSACLQWTCQVSPRRMLSAQSSIR